MKKIIRTQLDVFEDTTKPIICNQIDKVQREGVLSINEEIKLFEQQKKFINKNIDISKAELKTQLEKDRKLKEVHDLFDEKIIIDKMLKKNKEKIENLQEERKQMFKELETNYSSNNSNTNTNNTSE